MWRQPHFKAFDLKFDQPIRELGFHGVPHEASTFIMTTSSCLVELIETSFVVITLSKVEIVCLERVGVGQKNFDMTLIFKDLKRDVFRIDSIPPTSLDNIKEWLDTSNLKYYECSLSLNWWPILKTIINDPKMFINDGGWEVLNMVVSDSDFENSKCSDKEYLPSNVQSDFDSRSDDKDDQRESPVESEDDEGEDYEEEMNDDQGNTWEELEMEASHDDRAKVDGSDSEEERAWRKMKTLGKAWAPEERYLGGNVPKRTKFR